MDSPLELDDGGEWMSDLEQLLSGCTKPTAIDSIGGIYCNLCHCTYINKKEFDSHYTKRHHKLPSEIIYTCVACHKEIAPYPNFRNHCYQVHVAKDKFKCDQCHRLFSRQSALNSHIDSVHLFKCALCQKEFSSKSELHTHQNYHKRDKDKPPYPCHECSKMIESVDMCEMHIDDHCKIVYPCPICNETAGNKMDIAKHVTKHFDEVLTSEIVDTEINADCSVDMLGGVLCCYCDELFKNRPDFDHHYSLEHSDKVIIYSCNICGKQYPKYHLFADHCYFHVSKNRFECVDCGKFFPRLSLLVLHTEAFHALGSADNKPFGCSQCGHAFGTAPRLREHLRVVHTLNAFSCPEEGCDMTFDTPRDLVLHQRQHQVSSSNNWCRECGLQFTTLSSCHAHLDVHRKTHYACPVCNRNYREKYFIAKHIPQHFESVLHVCKVCGKVFNARSRLVEHTKTHSEIRRHKCSYCGKGFMRPHQLEQHLNIHTGLKPHKCEICSKTFANSPNLAKHLKNIHNIERKKIKTVDGSKKPAKSVSAAKNTKIINKRDKTDVKSESGIDSTSPEISLDTYIFGESDDSTMDSTDPVNIAQDWCVLNENSVIDNSLQYTDMLPVANATYDTEMKSTALECSAVTQSTILREYGPEFNIDDGINLDDHYLPHIDPLLTIKPHNMPSSQKLYADEFETPGLPAGATVPQTPWEPLITKVYHSYESDDLNRLSIMNTDIY